MRPVLRLLEDDEEESATSFSMLSKSRRAGLGSGGAGAVDVSLLVVSMVWCCEWDAAGTFAVVSGSLKKVNSSD